jgi:hypothetical protein
MVQADSKLFRAQLNGFLRLPRRTVADFADSAASAPKVPCKILCVTAMPAPNAGHLQWKILEREISSRLTKFGLRYYSSKTESRKARYRVESMGQVCLLYSQATSPPVVF